MADPAFLRALFFAEFKNIFNLISVVCVVDANTFLPSNVKEGMKSIETEQVSFSSCVVGDAKVLPDLLKGVEFYCEEKTIVDQSDITEIVQHVFFPRKGSWKIDYVLTKCPEYFKDAVPFRRHQMLISYGSLVGIGNLDQNTEPNIMQWIKNYHFLRVKGVLYFPGQRKVVIDGKGEDVKFVEKMSYEAPTNKLSFVGSNLDSFTLQKSLSQQTGVDLSPSVLYSAPSPDVDTGWQRIILAILALYFLTFPSFSFKLRMIAVGLLCLYFFLSIKNKLPVYCLFFLFFPMGVTSSSSSELKTSWVGSMDGEGVGLALEAGVLAWGESR